MAASLPPGARRRAPLLYWRERRWSAFVFLATLLGGLALTSQGANADIFLVPLVAALLTAVVADRIAAPIWHWLANRYAERKHYRVLSPVVIDGDTIHDAAIGERYRFANIDAPEIDGRCSNERQRAELARLAVTTLIKRASNVTVRRTARRDIYDRRVAFVYADGADIGEALVGKGFARPWRGRRERWCGPTGGLAKIGETRAMPISCKTCKAWSRY
jgi:endonuclease YncB( thermonuclease family)